MHIRVQQRNGRKCITTVRTRFFPVGRSKKLKKLSCPLRRYKASPMIWT